MSRRAKKREERRKDLAAYIGTHDAVPTEVHLRLKAELERVSAVLADLLEEQRGAAVPAREITTWVKNPEAVSFLLEGHATDRDGGCDGCGSYAAHWRQCTIAAAWRVLGDPRGVADIDRAHEEALWMDETRRTAPIRIPPGPPINVVSSPFVPPGTAYLMNPADFALRPAVRGAFINPAEFPNLTPADYLRIMDDANLGPPPIIVTTPRASEDFRREYLGEFPDREPQCEVTCSSGRCVLRAHHPGGHIDAMAGWRSP